jgi:hypothetical protein
LESYLAGVDTVQALGWSVVERKQPYAELEAAKRFAENVHWDRSCDVHCERWTHISVTLLRDTSNEVHLTHNVLLHSSLCL